MAYELQIASDTAYENLIAEVFFGNGSMVVVSQERNREDFEISFYAPHSESGQLSNGPMLVDLDEFMTALSEAKRRLRLLDAPHEPENNRPPEGKAK